jgi:hypothetical protein
MIGRIAAGLCVCGFAATALAAEAPLVRPARDVDVTYKVPVAAPASGQSVATLQRLRYSVALQKQRLDLPTSGTWMELDFAAGRLYAVRDSSREIVDLPAPPNALQPGGGAGFVREGSAVVAGQPCTEWRTRDTRGAETIACYTADGVLLRAMADGHVMTEAVSVNYASQPMGVFALPEGYSHQQK